MEQKQIDYSAAQKVLGLYPYDIREIHLLSSKNKQTIWGVETNEGMKVLRQLAVRPERMLFYAEAHLHLQGKGFPVAPLRQTKNNGLCVGGEGIAFALHDHLPGNEISYYDIEKLVKVMELLGQFHRASQGFTPSKQSKKRNRLGKWRKSYLWKSQELEGYKKLALTFKDDVFSQLFLENIDDFVKFGKEALKFLRTPAYVNWTTGNEKWNGFCHKDFSLSYFTERDGKVQMKAVPPIVIDLPTKDIQSLLLKIMKKMAVWDDELAIMLLRAYDSSNPLSEDQYRVLFADLLFPHLISSVVRKYYLKQKKTWSDEKYLWELQTSISVEQTKMEMLNNFTKIYNAIKE